MTAFTVPAAQLADTTGWLEKLIPTRPHVPVLGGVLLTADTTGVTAAAYDYDVAATATLTAAAVTAEGTVLLSGRLLAAVARAVGKTADVTVTCDTGQATLTAGRGEWVLPLLPVADYPALPDLGDPAGDVDAAVLADAAARVLPASARDDTIPMLTGVKVESHGPRLTLTCTDRWRLSTATIDWKPAGDHPVDLLAPAALLAQIVRGATGTLHLHTGHNNKTGFGAAGEHRRVTGRLLDAQFPRWRALLAHDTDHWATVDTAALREACEQVAVYGDRMLRLDITAGRAELSTAEDQRTARADIPVHALTGDPVTVGLNPAYLRDALAGLGDTTRVFLPAAPTRPLLFTTDGDTPDTAHQHVVMPVRLNEHKAAA